MNDYFEMYNLLNAQFDENADSLELPDNIVLFAFNFISEKYISSDTCNYGFKSDHFQIRNFKGNQGFRYYIFRNKKSEHRDAIVLLHGLNEKRWDKYLSWAHHLVKNTGSDVILFPISFHMNRAPLSWSDPREMSLACEKRKNRFSGLFKSTVANVALSERLTYKPQHFFYSGFQSADDIIRLTESIKNGTHPAYKNKTKVNFFSYSIGAFLTQILILSNPEGVLDDSKFFIFAGGTSFDTMNGTSRYIMDNIAFKRLRHFYSDELNDELKKDQVLSRIFSENNHGEAFRMMLAVNKMNKIRKKIFSRFEDQIQITGLAKDKVIPVDGIRRTMEQFRIRILDFMHPYSHENPFPVSPVYLSNKVDYSFKKVFNAAGKFFCN